MERCLDAVNQMPEARCSYSVFQLPEKACSSVPSHCLPLWPSASGPSDRWPQTSLPASPGRALQKTQSHVTNIINHPSIYGPSLHLSTQYPATVASWSMKSLIPAETL
ncbi:hypothetical protein AALO_G00245200 [Alosa alosa]|uniref:Uncharacterized protein n=1 Tax=Alosa alosa TaxID=278164 RepID=A0AAV6FWX2_9TELE|nr:hypothetical protein AALO_G00245200 [Alosa alosa]